MKRAHVSFLQNYFFMKYHSSNVDPLTSMTTAHVPFMSSLLEFFTLQQTVRGHVSLTCAVFISTAVL
jgi:hypothetical protein